MVPVYGFGLTDCYSTSKFFVSIQRFFHKKLGMALPVFFSRYGLLPNPTPLRVVMGKPIVVPKVDPKKFGEKPDPALVDKLHNF